MAVGGTYRGTGWNFDFLVARFNADGTPDTTFGTDGSVTTDFNGDDDEPFAVALQSDGKIVVAGVAWTDPPPRVGGQNQGFDFALARYNSDGTLDPSFGVGGKVTTAIGALADYGTALVLHSDGRMTLAGLSTEWITDTSIRDLFAVARYNSDGTLDASFGEGGKTTTRIGGYPDGAAGAAAVVEQADGKVVVAGGAHDGESYDFALVRYNVDGSLDSGFGNDGKVITRMSDRPNGTDEIMGLVLQTDGKLVAAGYADTSRDYGEDSNFDFALARYNSDGTLDSSFDVDGKVFTTLSPYADGARALVAQSDGKFVAAGYSEHSWGGDSDFVLVRYNSSGGVDRKFGSGGVASIPLSSYLEFALGVALDGEGRLVAVGGSYLFPDYSLILARYLNDMSQCAPEPEADCISVNAVAKLLVADNFTHTRRKVRFQWAKGAFPYSTFSDPATNTDNTLCVYDETSHVVGLKVTARKGARRLTTQGSSAPRVKLGNGLRYPVRAQLRNSNGVCWETDFTSTETKTNEPTLFRAARALP